MSEPFCPGAFGSHPAHPPRVHPPVHPWVHHSILHHGHAAASRSVHATRRSRQGPDFRVSRSRRSLRTTEIIGGLAALGLCLTDANVRSQWCNQGYPDLVNQGRFRERNLIRTAQEYPVLKVLLSKTEKKWRKSVSFPDFLFWENLWNPAGFLSTFDQTWEKARKERFRKNKRAECNPAKTLYGEEGCLQNPAQKCREKSVFSGFPNYFQKSSSKMAPFQGTPGLFWIKLEKSVFLSFLKTVQKRP